MLTLSACAVAASTDAASVDVNGVQVMQGAAVTIQGRSSLSPQDCIKTELFSGDQTLEWWPRDLCAVIEANGDWSLTISLSDLNPPASLDADREYVLHAYWPDNPDAASDRLAFDLSGPPQP